MDAAFTKILNAGCRRRGLVLAPGDSVAARGWTEVIAVDLPGDDPHAGLPEYARLVGAAIDGRSDVVLVAQSLGGFTAPMAAAAVPVSAIVLVSAMIPVPGETPGAWWDKTGQPRARVAAAERGGYSTEFDRSRPLMAVAGDQPRAARAERPGDVPEGAQDAAGGRVHGLLGAGVGTVLVPVQARQVVRGPRHRDPRAAVSRPCGDRQQAGTAGSVQRVMWRAVGAWFGPARSPGGQ
jgi:hypothetical protein